MKSSIQWIAGLCALLWAGQLFAQNSDKLVITSGNVCESGGRYYAYVLWQPGDITSTFGKRFAIYRKNGDIPSADAYTKLGTQELQKNPATIRALLKLGEKVDFNASVVNSRIAGIYQDTVTGSDADNGPDENLGAAGKLSYLISAAEEDPDLLNQILLLGRSHAGVMQALGHAFVIEMPAGKIQTFEVREVDAVDNHIRVIGRVEIDADKPFVPPAPGPPVQVLHEPIQVQYVHSPKDNLNARFRWGQDTNLRRAMPQTFGFDLLRVKESCAIKLGWDVSAPPAEFMADAIKGLATLPPGCDVSDIARVNHLPIMTDPPLTLPFFRRNEVAVEVRRRQAGPQQMLTSE